MARQKRQITLMKTLHLTLKKKWFDMIASGEKKEEYRELKDFWRDRLYVNKVTYTHGYPTFKRVFKKFDVVVFKHGYARNAPTITLEWLGCDIGPAKPEWSDNWQGNVFVIKLGKIINP
jgi:hypothetical protein